MGNMASKKFAFCQEQSIADSSSVVKKMVAYLKHILYVWKYKEI